MPEWWSYGLGDFLLFSPRTYYRLIERYNSGLWPLHLVAVAAGIALLAVQRRPTPGRTRAACAILAIAWAWVGWAFLHRRYATINWAAEYFACGFAVEAVLLAVVAGRPDWLRLGDRRGPAALIGTVVLALALVYPVMAPLAGRPWPAAECFGLLPDPTAIATLGLLLHGRGSARAALLVIPITWCVIAAGTWWVMASPT